MTRFHKRKPGSRKYRDFDESTLQKAKEAVSKGVSLRQASRQFNIPRSTLTRHMKSKPKSPGRPPVLSEREESILIERIQIMCEWGYPIDGLDLRYLVKEYLDRKGVVEKRFKNNMPSSEFLHHFKRRHPEITQRFASNIKRSRAMVSEEVITNYFDHLERELDKLPPNCIYNYDETNLSDDPGRKKALMKRGTKYPERIINSTKSSTSIMVCGSAAGELLPIYVVYKAENLYNNWIQSGPVMARYACTKSGWFEGKTFTDWFIKIFLPVAKRNQDTGTALIGDNLSSHFSEEVLRLCSKYNVKFICLPANSTDKTQPLDVAFFHPMKVSWRRILTNWKLANPGDSTVSKSQFPALLKKLVSELKEENLISGFKKCGIFPLDRSQVLSKLPHENASASSSGICQNVDDSLISLLKSHSGRDKIPKSRGKKIQHQPGMSISASFSSTTSVPTSDIEESDVDSNSESDRSSCYSRSIDDNQSALEKGSLKVTDWVVVKYRISSASKNTKSADHLYIGQITKLISNSVLEITFLRPEYSVTSKQYNMPSIDDKDVCDFENIVKVLPQPTMTRRGGYVFQ